MRKRGHFQTFLKHMSNEIDLASIEGEKASKSEFGYLLICYGGQQKRKLHKKVLGIKFMIKS